MRATAKSFLGILMIISWIMLTSIGITSAKYGKPMFPKISFFGANTWLNVSIKLMHINYITNFTQFYYFIQ